MNVVGVTWERDFDMRTLEDNAFLLLIIAVSLAFAWILLPFYGAVLWGTVTAILFVPVYRRLLKSMKQRRNLAAFSTVMIIIAIVILPMTLIGASLTQEALGLYEKIQSGELDLVRFFQQFHDACLHGQPVYWIALAFRASARCRKNFLPAL